MVFAESVQARSPCSKGQKRRASIGHKGMGFKSVLEITDAPEVFSHNRVLPSSPNDAVLAVQPLVAEVKLEQVSRAPVTRFPRPANLEDAEWARLRQRGMNTAFRFPFRDKMNEEQRDRLATVLRELPITSLVFLKHIGRVEVEIKRSSETRSFAWSVHRQQAGDSGWRDVSGFANRVTTASHSSPTMDRLRRSSWHTTRTSRSRNIAAA